MLIEHGVEVVLKAPELDRWRAGKRGDYGIGRYELPVTHREQLANRNAIPGQDKRFSPFECKHDLAAVGP